MRELYQDLLSHLTAKDLPALEEHELSRWAESDGCKKFPDCVSGECNPGCDMEQTYGDGGQWGAM